MARIILSRRSLPAALLLVMAGALAPVNSLAADSTLTNDSYASVKTPNKNFGSDPTMLVEIGNATAFLKFFLSNLWAGVTGNDVIKATLKLWVNNVRTVSQKRINDEPTSQSVNSSLCQNQSWRSFLEGD